MCHDNKNSKSNFITCCKSAIIVLAFVHFMIAGFVRAQMLNDYPKLTSIEPEMIQNLSGNLIKMKCSIDSCQNATFKWEYQACEPELYKQRCLKTELREWMPVPVNVKTRQCVSFLVLKNTNSRYNGLYRCLTNANDTDEMRIVKVYELRVTDQIKNLNGSPPKLLDVHPINATINKYVKVAIQCKVHSPAVPPLIFWFKQIDSVSTLNSFHYNNNSYINLNSSQIALPDNIYISKLIIEKTSEKDSGIYKCLAMNFFGASDEDVYLNVIDKDKVWEKDTSSFLMLFLIPLSLALVPVVVWLCYYRKKNLSKQKLQNSLSTDLFKYKPVLIRNLDCSSTFPECTSQRIV